MNAMSMLDSVLIMLRHPQRPARRPATLRLEALEDRVQPVVVGPAPVPVVAAKPVIQVALAATPPAAVKVAQAPTAADVARVRQQLQDRLTTLKQGQAQADTEAYRLEADLDQQLQRVRNIKGAVDAGQTLFDVSKGLTTAVGTAQSALTKSGQALEAANQKLTRDVAGMVASPLKDAATAAGGGFLTINARDNTLTAYSKTFANLVLNIKSITYWSDILTRLFYKQSVEDGIRQARTQIEANRQMVHNTFQSSIDATQKALNQLK
jgi:hypothetical protein